MCIYIYIHIYICKKIGFCDHRDCGAGDRHTNINTHRLNIRHGGCVELETTQSPFFVLVLQTSRTQHQTHTPTYLCTTMCLKHKVCEDLDNHMEQTDNGGCGAGDDPSHPHT